MSWLSYTIPLALPTGSLLFLTWVTWGQVTTTCTIRRRRPRSSSTASATTSISVPPLCHKPVTLPAEVFDDLDSETYILARERITSRPLPARLLAYAPPSRAPRPRPEKKKKATRPSPSSSDSDSDSDFGPDDDTTLSKQNDSAYHYYDSHPFYPSPLMTAFLRATMRAFSYTPQGLLLRTWLSSSSLSAPSPSPSSSAAKEQLAQHHHNLALRRRSFEQPWVTQLAFTRGDFVNGVYRVVYRGDGGRPGTERVELALDVPEFESEGEERMKGIIVAGVEWMRGVSR